MCNTTFTTSPMLRAIAASGISKPAIATHVRRREMASGAVFAWIVLRVPV